MFSEKKTIWIFVFMLLLSFAFSFELTYALDTQPAKIEPASGKVLKVVGKVQHKKIEEKAWHKTKAGDVITSGMEMRSGLRSSAIIRVQDNAIVKLESATRIAFTELIKKADTEKTRIFLSHGAIKAGILSEKIHSDFQIACPTAVLSREGTWGMAMNYDPATGRYRIRLDTEGLVKVVQTMTGKKIKIYPGQFVTNAMQMWVKTAMFKRMISLSDPFGSTKIEKLNYALNSGGLSAADPTGSRVTINNIKQGIALNGVHTQLAIKQIASAQRATLNRIILQRTLYRPRPNPEGVYNYRYGNFGTHASGARPATAFSAWLKIGKIK